MRQITLSQLKALHDLRRSDPARFLDEMTSRVQDDPEDPYLYFSRHYGLEQIGRLDLALADLDRSIELRSQPVRYLARGKILAKLGRHEDALADYARGEALDPEAWPTTFGPYYQAMSFAALGQERPAVAACEKLEPDFWSPGLAAGRRATGRRSSRSSAAARRRRTDQAPDGAGGRGSRTSARNRG